MDTFTLTFNTLEEQNLTNVAIFNELVRLWILVKDKSEADIVYDGDIEDYNTLLIVYKNLLTLDSKGLEQMELRIKKCAESRKVMS